MGNEFQEQYIPGLKNNQSRLFFAIVTIPLPKVKKKLPAEPFMLLKCTILGILCTLKNYAFLIIEFREGNQKN